MHYSITARFKPDTASEFHRLLINSTIESQKHAKRKRVCCDGSIGHSRLRFMVVYVLLAMRVLGGNVARGEVSYNRDVLPILSTKCFACHGADRTRRKANLRLDLPKEASAERDGVRAIVLGKLDQSELIRRIFSADLDEVMPPVDEGQPLSEMEKTSMRGS